MHAVIDVLPFQALTWTEWKQIYRQRIRVLTWISDFKSMTTGIHVATPKTRLVLPHYHKRKSDDHLSAPPREIRIGSEAVLVRLPAVKFKDWYFIPDGTHRLKGLRPGLVVLDYIEPTKRQRRGIADFQADWWQRRGV